MVVTHFNSLPDILEAGFILLEFIVEGCQYIENLVILWFSEETTIHEFLGTEQYFLIILLLAPSSLAIPHRLQGPK